MIFSLKQIKKLAEENVINEEKYNNLVEYFENYVYDENSFSEEDRKLIKAENNKGNFDLFSDKDLLNAKRNGIINDDEFTNMLIALKNDIQDITGLECIVKKEYVKNDDTLCFKTTPLSKVIILSFLSFGIYNIILSMNYWQTLKDNFGYKISPFWRGLCEVFTNFKLFPIFSKYFKNFNVKLAPIWLAIIYIICRSHLTLTVNNNKLDLYGVHAHFGDTFQLDLSAGIFALSQNFRINANINSKYSFIVGAAIFMVLCLMLILNFGGAIIYSVIQNKINKINKQYYPNAPKNNWNTKNVIWSLILALLLFINLISFVKNTYDNDKQWQLQQNGKTIGLGYHWSIMEYNSRINIKVKPHNSKKQPIATDWDSYVKQVESKIKRNWTPPTEYGSRQVTVKFTVGKNGELQNSTILKSSGVEYVDESAMKAVELSSPFDPLPKEDRGESVPIEFTFNYNNIK